MSFRVYLSPQKPGWPYLEATFMGKTFRLGKKTRTVIDVTFSGDIITRGTNNAGFHSGRWNGERIPGEQWMDWVKNATEVKV